MKTTAAHVQIFPYRTYTHHTHTVSLVQKHIHNERTDKTPEGMNKWNDIPPHSWRKGNEENNFSTKHFIFHTLFILLRRTHSFSCVAIYDAISSHKTNTFLEM